MFLPKRLRNPRSREPPDREVRVYFHAVLVQIELVSKPPSGWNVQKSVYVFQEDLAPQRCPKNYSQVRKEATALAFATEAWKADRENVADIFNEAREYRGYDSQPLKRAIVR